MKKVWSILAVLSMSLTALQAVETSVKQLSVDDFYKMKVYNNFDVSYRQSADSAGVIVIMASTEDISHVECVKASVLTGKGKISLTGKCREAELSVTGAGQIEADRLTARDVTCRIRGVGVIGCHATQKLTAKATGNGEVYYRGTPEIKKLSLGELSVRSLEGK